MFTISTGESLTRTAFPFESMVEIYASYDKVGEFSLSWNIAIEVLDLQNYFQTINYIRGTTQLQMKWRNYSRRQTGKNISFAKLKLV